MSAFHSLHWTSPDGLKLHACDYPGPGPGEATRLPVLCLPGLTRNARDFTDLAGRLAASRRVLALDLRGRGGSEAARDPATYEPLTYVADVRALLDQEGIDRYVAIGTSLGGLVAMLLAAAGAGLAGALLNDVGPELEAAGLSRIRNQVGRAAAYPTWMHAARALREANAAIHPEWQTTDWLAMAKRTHRLNSAGRVVLDYDLRLAEPLRVEPADPPPDLWPVLGALVNVPVLVVRGARSDLLSAATAARMVETLHDAELVTVANVGHAPTLDEAPVLPAIDRLLARADAR